MPLAGILDDVDPGERNQGESLQASSIDLLTDCHLGQSIVCAQLPFKPAPRLSSALSFAKLTQAHPAFGHG